MNHSNVLWFPDRHVSRGPDRLGTRESMSRMASAVIFIAAAGCACAGPPIVSQGSGPCPPAPHERPYTISVSNRSGDTVSLALRQAVANALAAAWGAEERQEPQAAGYDEVMSELSARVPRTGVYLLGKARLRAGDSAAALLTYRRGVMPELDVLSTVTPELHRLISSAVGMTIARAISRKRSADTLPLTMPGRLGEAMLELRFGWNPPAGAAVARFALRDREPRLASGASSLQYPEEYRLQNLDGSVLAGFIIDQHGRVDAGSVRIIRSDGDLFSRSVRQFLATVRFEPHLLDCVPRPRVVSQPFNFRLTR